MKIYIGSDHGGFDLKQLLIHHLEVKSGYSVEDVGDERPDPEDDFPVFAAKAARKLLESDDPDPRGILICRGGQGMAMAANRFKGVRAVVCWNEQSAQMTRFDNDSNMLCLPADALSVDEVKNIVHIWLNTEFSKAARFVRRNNELDELN